MASIELKKTPLWYLLDWSDRDKCLLFSGMVAVMQLFCWIIVALGANYTDFGQQYVSPKGLQETHWAFLLGELIWVGLFIWGLTLKRKRKHSKRFVTAFLYLYGVPFLFIGQMIGHFHPLLGVVVLGSGLIGCMLFGFERVIGPILFIFSLTAALVIGSIYGVIEYANLLVADPIIKTSVSGVWVFFSLLISLPFALGSFVVANVLLQRWHEREMQVQQLSLTDELTGLPNRRAVLDRGRHEVLRAQRNGDPLAIAMMDIDFFKRVNDTHGHAVGDKVLVEVSDQVNKHLRKIDMIGRVGGEEFVIVMPETNAVEALNIMERCRQQVEKNGFIMASGKKIRVTVSFGVCVASGVNNRRTLVGMLRLADRALYTAKNQGRNQTQVIEAIETAQTPVSAQA